MILFFFDIAMEASGINRSFAYMAGDIQTADPHCLYVQQVKNKLVKKGQLYDPEVFS